MKTRRFLEALLLCAIAALLLAAPPARAQVAGTVEGYNPGLSLTGSFYVGPTAVQPDGKMIIGGTFTTVGGAAHTNIARLNADGSVDASFTTSANSHVKSVAVQADGKILLGGDFTTVNGTARNRIARLNADGSLESTNTFNPGTGANDYVNGVAVQADGKIVLCGTFTTFNDRFYKRIARLNADGSLDTTFYETAPNDTVYSIAVQADGKIVLGGAFTSINNFPVLPRNRIARLNADGSVESTATFNTGTGANGIVQSVAVQADGKIVLGGAFTIYNGTSINRIARLHADGSLESGATFTVGTGANENIQGAGVQSVAVQADGKILLGGTFTTFNGTFINRIARLNANGSLESTATFNPGTGVPLDTVNGVAVQADGKIVLCGTFTTFNGSSRNKIARLANDPAPQTVSAPDQTQVLWSRGGSAPEVGPVTFELSTNGGTAWTPLGAGTRVGTTPNWQRTGLSLPPSGQLRARGRTAGGASSGSSGLVETVGSFTLPGIAVAQAGIVADGGSVSFGTVLAGSSGTPLTFTINNPGSASLTGLAVTKDGTDNAAFTVSALSATSIPVGAGTATFTVTFSSTTSGLKTAALHIASNLTGAINPYDINLTGRALSFTEDTDGDGMNDASEFQLAALGYDWQVGGAAQQTLVNTLFNRANGAGLYTTSQVQALNIGSPLLAKNPTNGTFKLTIGVQMTPSLTTNLSNFVAFPMNGPDSSTLINGQGKLEFHFPGSNNAAFFRLQSQ